MVIALLVIGYILIGLFSGTFYHVYNHHTDIELETGFIVMFWPLVIPAFTIYLIGKIIVNVFKFPAAWLSEKVYNIRNYIERKQFEWFLIRNNCYSQANNVIINIFKQTIKEYIDDTSSEYLISKIKSHDVLSNREYWEKINKKWMNR